MKNIFRRTLYLAYYLRKLDFSKFRKFLKFAGNESDKSRFSLMLDMLYCVYRYNISPLEYFQFHFYERSAQERSTYAGTGFMYEYQLRMNPPDNREVIENKVEFFRVFADKVGRQMITLKQLEADLSVADGILSNKSGKVVLKNSRGGSGKGIEIWKSKDLDGRKLLEQLKATNNDMVEEFVVQHNQLSELSPSGLNTLRVITQVDENGEPLIVAARLRVSVNSAVDNLAAGNIATAVNIENGVVESSGFYSDISKKPVTHHPASGKELLNFQVPFWQESRNLALESARRLGGSNRSIGWDIGISENGPVLIEGNHDWCKLVWQLPVQKGLKKELEKYQ